jgi:hypothetical protein
MHPLIAQPYGNGNGSADISINTRYRALDAIPFKKSIQFDMEMWHWADVIVNYAPVTMWYMKPGGTSNRGEETKLAKIPITTKRGDIYENAPISEGRLEGENLDATSKGGHISGQSMDLWSERRQLWWTDGKPGSELTVTFAIKEAGKKRISAIVTCAYDYGKVDIGINGEWVAKGVDCYADPGVSVKTVDLGVVDLKQGNNTFDVKIVGSNERMGNTRYMFGLDCLDVKMP